MSVLASQLANFLLLLLSARAVGIGADQVSFLEMLLSFSVARLLGAIPITPGGLGIVDAALHRDADGFGTSSDAALAAVWCGGPRRTFRRSFSAPALTSSGGGA